MNKIACIQDMTRFLLRGLVIMFTSFAVSVSVSANRIERKTCQAPDGVTIAYSASGAGETALVFIHGGLADRSFYDNQLQNLSNGYRVIALDLAGHGESGTDRKQWGLPEFGADVKAVADAENLKRIILFGNSLGGPVAVEAALLLKERAAGVVGIDTFHRIDEEIPAELIDQRVKAFQEDYPAALKGMVKQLFHGDADPRVMADAENRMMKTPRQTAVPMFLGMKAYNQAASVRNLTVPLRSINGDLYRTDVEGVRKIKPDFVAIIMKHTGHYPMLERPGEFNRMVLRTVEEILKQE